METNTSGTQSASRTYYAYGSTRSSSGILQTDRTYTGQKQDGTGLLYYNARYYDSGLGTFLSPDTLVPDPNAVIDYNRFLYARANPLRHVDSSGHCIDGVTTIVCIAVLLKVVDYGWSAYDAYNSSRVLADPTASRGDKLMAGLNLALTVLFEAIEPDDFLPVGLPADDVARHAMMNGVREVYAEGGEEAMERFLREQMGDQADELLGKVDELLGNRNELYGPFHRKESPTQTAETARMQEISGEIWGKSPRGSDVPTVQAYTGPLPDGASGIEFYTNVTPNSGTPRRKANWSGPRPGVRIEGEYAKICCNITKNTQR